MFKRVAIPMAAAAVLLTSGAAGAADLGAPVLRGSEVVAPSYEYSDQWSGVYLGGHVGTQFVHNRGFHSDATGTTRDDGTGRQVWNFEYDYMKAQFNYGVHLGIQRLFGAFLLGAEFSLDGPGGKSNSPWYNGNVAFTAPAVGGNQYQQRIGINWQASLVARAGFVHHKSMYYLLGGFAVANMTACTVLDDCNNPIGHVVKYSATRWGWVIGAGMEHKLTHNWSIRAEYRYTAYGSRSCLATDPCAINVNASDVRNRVDTHAVRVGVSYLFGAPALPAAPIIARY